jgi:LmbE family N-acetylglucosaminyl deacetylase
MLGEVADGRFPSSVSEIKDYFEQIKRETQPDVILTHRLDDRHQDHRTTAELTWQTWRNHLVLEYEIPKYEGDLGVNNLYVSFGSKTARRKVCHLMRHFGTQRRRAWFRPETFQAVMQLRAVECGGRVRFAEAFMARKLVF